MEYLNGTDHSSLEHYNRLLRIFRFYDKVNQTKKYSKENYIEVHEKEKKETDIHSEYVRLIKFMLNYLLVMHIISCLWFWVAKFVEGLTPDTWIVANGAYHYQDFDNYVVTVYFVISTMAMIGFGDIVPKTNIEILLGIFTMIFGLLFYALTIGILHSIFRNVDIR